jgi:cation:H+ antiporter
MQIAIWTLFLAISIFVLVRGADLFVTGSKKIGFRLGMSPFIIGVLIVGLGTSLPELASSVAGVISGVPEIVIANAVGSNITNILLIVGVLAAFGGTVYIKQDLLRTELPIFLIATVHFIAAVYDGVVDRLEGLLLFGTFFAYLWYLFSDSSGTSTDDEVVEEEGTLLRATVFIILGLAALLVGAHFTVVNAVNLASAFAIPIGLVSIAAIAIGTSLPELFVSIQAMKTGEADLAVGNVFGSNAFNMLLVVGLPALLAPLPADRVVMEIGLTVLAAASIIFFVSGLARQIMRWEGLMMLLFFGFFLLKLADFV